MHPKILLVDDNLDNLMLLKWILTSENFAVETATSARGALQALARSLPDAMLTDIQMPDMDGLALTRQVRQDPRSREIPIIAVSANAMKESIQEAEAAGCDGYIIKPVDTRTFAASVREQLARDSKRKAKTPGFGPAIDDPSSPGGEFLADCILQVKQLVNHRSDSERRQQACEVLHFCAGTAGVLGYPDVTTLARRLESHASVMSEQEFVDGLHELGDLLAKAQPSAVARTM